VLQYTNWITSERSYQGYDKRCVMDTCYHEQEAVLQQSWRPVMQDESVALERCFKRGLENNSKKLLVLYCPTNAHKLLQNC